MLEIERKPEYLSPSSIISYIMTPHTAYLERLATPKQRVNPVGPGALKGSYFDCFVKTDLFDIEAEAPNLGEFAHLSSEEIKEARYQATRVFNNYKLIESYKSLDLINGIDKKFNVGDVPVYGRLDASAILQDGRQAPFDWKVFTGSPAPGYQKRWIGQSMTVHRGLPIEQVKFQWALQGCIYGWALGWGVGKEPIPVIFECLNQQDSLSVSRYESCVSTEFQNALYGKIQRLWAEIQDGTYVERLEVLNKADCLEKAKKETWY